MDFVLDASMTASWAFPDEGDSGTMEILTRLDKDQAYVPSLWWFEVRNMLVMGERRKRITEANTKDFLNNLGRLNIVIDNSPDENAILALSRDYKLTVYDAAYLELARRKGVPLATLDAALRRAAGDAGVAPL